MSDIKTGFLFDLDGVLIDSESQYSKIWAQINREFPTGVEALELKIKGGTLEKILAEYFPDEATKIKVKDRLHYLESLMEYDYLPGAYEFLNKLEKRGLPKALVTSSDNKKMDHLEEELPGFINIFDYVVTADQISASKPSPEGYLLAANKLGCQPENCAVFEDSLQGVMAGRNAGAFVVGIEGTLPAATLQPYSDIIVRSLAEINLDKLIETLRHR